ncbi:MAG: DUF1080 domain-containing protein [Bacteroidales bacterium]|nr:DUF1080 domain-containing protein [Bacteroidales bacterium]
MSRATFLEILCFGALMLAFSCTPREYEDFTLTAEFRCTDGSSAAIAFGGGYEVILHNGPVDGTLKSGSLAHVRNLYRSMAEDGEWTPVEIRVKGKSIAVDVDGSPVVRYCEPENPWRAPEHADQLLSKGSVELKQLDGRTGFRKVRVTPDAEIEGCKPVDEASDPVIRFQQEDFPVIDWHVHLKGGLDAETAMALQMEYGINYCIAPNAGEGGVGEMLSNDEDVYAYYDKISRMPFLRGVQGEGRKWTADFSQEALGVFDCLFTDAMTIVDHKGRVSRLYHPEEVLPDGLSDEEYMDLIVDQTVKILSNEPADIYANATYLPDSIGARYDELWTDSRIDRVLDVLEKNGIALEISARYMIPSERIIRKAHERGIRFTFGTNNVNDDFGRLEYSLGMARRCGLTKDDMWFPTMSTKAERPVILYNFFDSSRKKDLFNGENLDGWTAVAEEGAEGVFSVRDGVISVSGQPFGYLRTNEKFGDYSLHVEWRYPEGNAVNSGIFQRVQDEDKVWPEGIECQLMAGKAGDIVGLSGAKILEVPSNPGSPFTVKTRNHPGEAIELPEGEWNRAEIICKGNNIRIYINGSLENEATLALDEGFIALQSEGGPVEFRNVYIYR